ncbi:unnamed protein product [Prorocentrum cordatum]|uniref:Uncharacterized protein n=1 Tax=Prorocentrum cordatum TaxID=2364126 RepID=A0ABN9R6C7_9DINO|nr:unnamed protein product [Polarella glacialis]
MHLVEERDELAEELMETRALAWERKRAAAPAPSLAPEVVQLAEGRDELVEEHMETRVVGPVVVGPIPPFPVFGVEDSVGEKDTVKVTADLSIGDGTQASFDLEGVFALAHGLPVDIRESECMCRGPEGSEGQDGQSGPCTAAPACLCAGPEGPGAIEQKEHCWEATVAANPEAHGQAAEAQERRHAERRLERDVLLLEGERVRWADVEDSLDELRDPAMAKAEVLVLGHPQGEHWARLAAKASRVQPWPTHPSFIPKLMGPMLKSVMGSRRGPRSRSRGAPLPSRGWCRLALTLARASRASFLRWAEVCEAV